MKYELICIDIDGTLLNSEKELLPEVRRAVRRASEAGMEVVLGSARMPAGVELIEKELGVGCMKICDAGAYILAGNECISSRHFPAADMLEIYEEYAEKNRLNMWIFKDRDWYITGMDPYIAREIEIIGYHPKVVDVHLISQEWKLHNSGPSKLLIAAEPELIQQIQNDIRAKLSLGIWLQIDIARSSDQFLEIFPKGVNKGSALQKICEIQGLPLEKTVAFGDHEMDIPLIAAAGLGIAMGNAVDSLKKIADYVTLSNDEAGVAYALEQILEQKL